VWIGIELGICYVFAFILHSVIVFYHIFRIVYFNGIRLAANWSAKARQWVDGRKHWQQTLQQKFERNREDKVIWMHCASLGEFEQGRPILEKLKSKNPKIKIVLSFFSPSGYEIRKDYNGADVVMYLPEDSKENANAFLNIVQPSLAIFVKYEFWHFYLAALKDRNIETILVSGIFRNTQPFFLWWGGFYKNMLLNFSHLFVQNQASAQLLASINIKSNVTVCGDTRFDRVLEMAEQWQPVSAIESFLQPNKKILVAGSTWKEDEELIAQWFHQQNEDWQLIIAPHEIDEVNIAQLQQLFSNSSILFSELTTKNSELRTIDCIIINTIGHLSKLYKYATICYVGGGFTKSGIHNSLEAAVYCKPVITGPNIRKYHEAIELKEAGGLFIINDGMQLHELIKSLNVEESGKKAGTFVQQHTGATTAIMNYIQEKRLLTSA
jgi:3-deoxy-D-manno-octulosonic-acid transferase